MKLKELNNTLKEGIGIDMLKTAIPKKLRKSAREFINNKLYHKIIVLYNKILNDKKRNLSKHDALIQAAKSYGVVKRDEMDDLFAMIKT